MGRRCLAFVYTCGPLVRRDRARHLRAFRGPADLEGLLGDLYQRKFEGKQLGLIFIDGCSGVCFPTLQGIEVSSSARAEIGDLPVWAAQRREIVLPIADPGLL